MQLKASGKVNGIMVIHLPHREDLYAIPDHSPDTSCPNQGYGKYRSCCYIPTLETYQTEKTTRHLLNLVKQMTSYHLIFTQNSGFEINTGLYLIII